MKVRDDGVSFLPLLFGFEVDYAVWGDKFIAKAPFVSRSETGRNGG